MNKCVHKSNPFWLIAYIYYSTFVSEIYSNLGSLQFKYDQDQGYYRLVGADTWRPFSNLIYMEAHYENNLSITVPSGTHYVRFCPNGENKLSNLLKVGESQSITGSNGVVSTITFTNSTTVTITRSQATGWIVLAFFM